MIKLDQQTVTIKHVNPRMEKHNNKLVLSCDIKMVWRTLAEHLDEIAPGYRTTMFRSSTDPQQREKTGDRLVELTDAGKFSEPVKLKTLLINMRTIIAHGVDEQSNITLDNCKVSGISFEPLEGGACEITFRVQSNIDEKSLGMLAGKIQSEVSVSIEKNPDLVDAMKDTAPKKKGRKPRSDMDTLNEQIKAGDPDARAKAEAMFTGAGDPPNPPGFPFPKQGATQ